MVERKKSYIKFKGYQTKNIKFKINDKLEFDNSEEFEMDLDFNLKYNTKGNDLEVVLTAIIFKDYIKFNKPFTLEVSIKGMFTFANDLEEKLKEDLIYKNSVAILYPYLRMMISNITCNSGISPIILPVMNVSAYLEDKYKKNL